MIRENDSFGRKAPKLAALLSQSSEADVLFLGDILKDWEDDFAGYFRNLIHPRKSNELESALSSGASFHLIMASFKGIAGLSRDTVALLRRLRIALQPNGTLIYLVENRLSLARLARHAGPRLSAGKMTAPVCRHHLRMARFERMEEFLPLPRFWGAEEFVSSQHGDAVLPSDASVIEIGLNKIGLLPMFSEGWYHVCSGPGGGTVAFLNKIAAQLNERSGLAESVVLERFDLRDRGALVILLHTVPTGHRFVCRVTTDETSDRTVRRNAEWAERIHRSPAISPEIKRYVPRPVGIFPLDERMEYVEELIEGTIAWKLAGRSRIEPLIFEGMCDFLLEFNRQTGVQVSIDERLFVRLSLSPQEISMDHETAALTNALTERLRRCTVGTDRRVVWSHGDFGYGNAIADPRTGKLAGIVDWDQGREDLAGVDLVNFLVFRERIRGMLPLTKAFANVAERIADGGLLSVDTRLRYPEEFPLRGRQGLETLAWVTLRIAQRAATYPALLARSRDEVQSLLRWACSTVPESVGI